MNTHCVTIAYKWVFVPPKIFVARPHDAYDLIIVVTTCAGNLKSEQADVQTQVYRARLPQREQASRLSDVSGVMGLLLPSSSPHLQQRAAAAERLLSDAIIWAISEQQIVSGSPDERTFILLQGPLLPKLRGRLLYRGLSSDVRLFCLTYDPEWLQSVEGCRRMVQTIEASDDISPVYPPPGVDRATRCWVARQRSLLRTAEKDVGSDFFYHIEALVDRELYLEHPDWENLIASEIKEFLGSAAEPPSDRFSTPPLPALLQRATYEALLRQNAEAHYVPIHALGSHVTRKVLVAAVGEAVADTLYPPRSKTKRQTSSEVELLQASSEEMYDRLEIYSRITTDAMMAKLPVIV